MDDNCDNSQWTVYPTRPQSLIVFQGHIFSASPVDEWWTSKPGFDLAFDYEVFLTAMAGIDIALDVFTLLLPLPVIKSLHVNGKKKLSLIGIFSLGFL